MTALSLAGQQHTVLRRGAPGFDSCAVVTQQPYSVQPDSELCCPLSQEGMSPTSGSPALPGGLRRWQPCGLWGLGWLSLQLLGDPVGRCGTHTVRSTLPSPQPPMSARWMSKGRAKGERPAARRQGDRDRWGVKGEKGVSVRAPPTGGALTPEPCCNLTGINSMNAPDSFCH